jgi:hypothetical protein
MEKTEDSPERISSVIAIELNPRITWWIWIVRIRRIRVWITVRRISIVGISRTVYNRSY